MGTDEVVQAALLRDVLQNDELQESPCDALHTVICQRVVRTVTESPLEDVVAALITETPDARAADIARIFSNLTSLDVSVRQLSAQLAEQSQLQELNQLSADEAQASLSGNMSLLVAQLADIENRLNLTNQETRTKLDRSVDEMRTHFEKSIDEGKTAARADKDEINGTVSDLASQVAKLKADMNEKLDFASDEQGAVLSRLDELTDNTRDLNQSLTAQLQGLNWTMDESQALAEKSISEMRERVNGFSDEFQGGLETLKTDMKRREQEEHRRNEDARSAILVDLQNAMRDFNNRLNSSNITIESMINQSRSEATNIGSDLEDRILASKDASRRDLDLTAQNLTLTIANEVQIKLEAIRGNMQALSDRIAKRESITFVTMSSPLQGMAPMSDATSDANNLGLIALVMSCGALIAFLAIIAFLIVHTRKERTFVSNNCDMTPLYNLSRPI